MAKRAPPWLQEYRREQRRSKQWQRGSKETTGPAHFLLGGAIFIAAFGGYAAYDQIIPDRSAERYFARCNDAWAAGVAPISRKEPGYREGLDGDGDGIACEPYR